MWMKKRTKDFRYIIHLAQKRNCKVVVTNRDQLDQMASSKTHGGMLLEAKPDNLILLKKSMDGVSILMA